MKKIALASDQGGFEQKEALKSVITEMGYEFEDYGVHSDASVDYPDVIYPAVKAVADGEYEMGIILCGTGIGASIVANKVRGIRAALVTSTEVAELTREHNDSNILALAGRTTELAMNEAIVRTWLGTAYSQDERHTRRINKIKDIEIKEGR
ncbi:RpiB/LacA/LacB family sugar-phosphate isomerase [Erysipelothrix sp. HDW6C]|uniref:RpiB/LacA/LacB family sugar-phosphate isomerase n=1 Tax=Erysipelothrix sp. HDW6C TaxID=2714930 RepID=UPI0014099733|nr:RpiB/LacA/LacB family sugar-phosphate isomerase [Erysipelothrix sp. HDW6C]QIK68960.1 RpiB/LacA/LacB family sugar-phosphate isomerase [Erysipelothrix sp. HDW6C]